MATAGNKITNERQTLQTPGRDDYYFIIPKAAPYFVSSLKVFNDSTGVQYKEGVDYLPGHYFVEAMDSVDRPIAGSIRFLKRSISGIVRLEYHTLGGDWGFNDTAILAELSNKALNPLTRSWGNIAEMPYSFPVVDHDQSIDSIVGSEELKAAIDGIASVLESTASGSTKSHIEDYNNPHRVTASQVNLGNVPNWAVATDVQAKAGTSQTGFMTPYLVSLAISALALAPLNAHLADKNNPHGVDATDVGLGLVANFPPASRDEAIDPTVNNRYLTPYTASLLLASQSSEGQYTALQTMIQNHINDKNNPHGTTAAQVGAYSKTEIDAKLQTVQAQDSPRFDGQTAAEFRNTLPSFNDITTILNRIGSEFSDANVKQTQLVVADPRSEADLKAIEAAKLVNARAGYNGYYVFGSDNTIKIVKDSAVLGTPATIAKGVDKIVFLKDATYWLDVNGAINRSGSAALAIPSDYLAGSGFNSANAMTSIYANKTAVYVANDNGRLVRIAGGVATVLQTSGAFGVATNTEHYNAGEMTVQEMMDGSYLPVGSAAWVQAFNTLKTQLTVGIEELTIGDDKLVLVLTDNTVRIYSINRANGVTLTLQTNPTGMPANPTTTNGSFRHYVVANAAGDYLVFGDDSFGQLQINTRLKPFTAVVAGCGFTVTVDKNHGVQFWGDSPDNSLLYRAA